jgi:hypothetical protein
MNEFVILLLIIVIFVMYWDLFEQNNDNQNSQYYQKDEFKNLVSLQSENNTSIQTNVIPQELNYQNELRDNLQNYSQLVAEQNDDLTYYHNNYIDQSKIRQNANDIINQTSKINYSDVETGIQKCHKKCDGTCYEFGWTGYATCYPPQKQFDWGTFHKNPAFINSLKPNPQNVIINTK